MNHEFIKQVGLAKWFFRTVIWQLNKRLLRNQMWITFPNKEKLYLEPHKNFASEAFVTNGDVDWGTEYLFEELVPKGGTFLDVGGHIGYFSVLLYHECEKIYCFEPDENNFSGLELNLKNRPRIEHVKKAVAEASGEKIFYVSPSGATSSLEKNDSYQEVKIECTSIDDFLSDKNENITAIKTDIEGYDLFALKGAYETIKKNQPVIITEQPLNDELHDFAESINYQLYGYHRTLPEVKDTLTKIERGKDYYLKMIFLVPPESGIEKYL